MIRMLLQGVHDNNDNDDNNENNSNEGIYDNNDDYGYEEIHHTSKPTPKHKHHPTLQPTYGMHCDKIFSTLRTFAIFTQTKIFSILRTFAISTQTVPHRRGAGEAQDTKLLVFT